MSEQNKSKWVFNQIIECTVYIMLASLVGVTIYVFTKLLIVDNVTLNFAKPISADNIESIKEALSVGNSIISIIAVSAIFFTVLVVTVNLLQFLKTKEVDNLVAKVEGNLGGVEGKISKLDGKIIKVDDAVSEMETKLKELRVLKDVTLFYINMSKAEEEYNLNLIKRGTTPNHEEIIRLYQKCVSIVERYTNEKINEEIEEQDISRVYNKLSTEYCNIGNYTYAEKYMELSLKYKDIQVDEMAKGTMLSYIYNKTGKNSKSLLSLKQLVSEHYEIGIEYICNTINTEFMLNGLLNISTYRIEVEKLLSSLVLTYKINNNGNLDEGRPCFKVVLVNS